MNAQLLQEKPSPDRRMLLIDASNSLGRVERFCFEALTPLERRESSLHGSYMSSVLKFVVMEYAEEEQYVNGLVSYEANPREVGSKSKLQCLNGMAKLGLI